MLIYFVIIGEIKTLNCTMRIGAEIEVEDSVVANFTYENGSIGSLEVTIAAADDFKLLYQ